MLSPTESGPGLGECVDPQVSTAWPSIFYFYPDDVARLHAKIIAQGFKPTPLQVTTYGMREFSLPDPDRHMLSFGQDADA